jgi:hypothetical protein
MVLSDDAKKAMIHATRDTAAAMIDDLQHMREVIAKTEPTPGDIRRLSNPLRRILLDNGGDLRKIAPPRIGKLELLVPDIRPLIKSGEKVPYNLFSAGLAEVLGMSLDALMMPVRQVPGYVPERVISVRLDGFLSQRIICFNNVWISRADVIKYVANVGHGVHSGDPREPKHELIKIIRHIATVHMDDSGVFTMTFDQQLLRSTDPKPQPSTDTDKPLAINKSAMDIVLIQLMSAIRYLTTSPDILRLEEIIRQE